MTLKEFVHSYGFEKYAKKFSVMWKNWNTYTVTDVLFFDNGYEFTHNNTRYRVVARLLGQYPFYCVEKSDVTTGGDFKNVTYDKNNVENMYPACVAWIGTLLVDRARDYRHL